MVILNATRKNSTYVAQVGIQTTQIESTQVQIVTTQFEFHRFLKSDANRNDVNRIGATRSSSVFIYTHICLRSFSYRMNIMFIIII